MTERGTDDRHDGPSADVIVLGSGLAGLTTALSLAPLRVLLVTKTLSLYGGSSLLAQGGIAACVSEDDSPAEHAADTVMAGAGLCDTEVVARVAEEGPDAVTFLERHGVAFDCDETGRLLLGIEGAHGKPRILHAGGDAAGRHVIAALAKAVQDAEHITLHASTMAVDLAFGEGPLHGLWAVGPDAVCRLFRSPAVVLATGGSGALWPATSNPPEATADGIAMAARQGAVLADLEFAQFHPTTLLTGQAAAGRLPLLSEALRGAGALLVDGDGHRFMADEHPLAELAPRDVVARAVWRRRQRGEEVRLDLRPALAKRGPSGFPQAVAACRAADFDPMTEAVPVTPALHYHMGGVLTDERGRSSLSGLWACGEVATTGLHGANRLASNSLLEAVVFGRRAAEDILSSERCGAPESGLTAPALPARGASVPCLALQSELRAVMGQALGVERAAPELDAAIARLQGLQDRLPPSSPGRQSSDAAEIRTWLETRNMLLAARLVAQAARQREESRGAHFRRDFPMTRESWARHIALTLADLTATNEGSPLYASG